MRRFARLAARCSRWRWCRPRAAQQPEGAVKVVVIGGEPKLRDPAHGPLSAPDAVLLQNVAQGLVRFDATGNIVAGLAERWNVSDDGLSYIFRIASTNWPDGRKITAQQVARLLKRQLATRSQNPLKDALGAVEDIVAMTDRVIEIRLVAPRPNLLPLLAQPEFAILREGPAPGRSPSRRPAPDGELRLTREIASPATTRAASSEEVLLAGAQGARRDRSFRSRQDRPRARRHLRRPSVRPAGRRSRAEACASIRPRACSGWSRCDAAAASTIRSRASCSARRSTATRLIAALGVPELAPRARRCSSPASTALPRRRAGLDRQRRSATACRPFRRRPTASSATPTSPPIRIALPDGPGAELLLRELTLDWGALGFKVERAASAASADFALVDEVAPSTSAAWFVRQFRCEVVAGVRSRSRRAAGCRPGPPVAAAALRPARPGRGENRRRRSCSSRSPRPFAGRWSRGASRALPGTATPVTRSPTWRISRSD